MQPKECEHDSIVMEGTTKDYERIMCRECGKGSLLKRLCERKANEPVVARWLGRYYESKGKDILVLYARTSAF